MWVRHVAGWTIIAAGTGLAAISGVLAYNGFEAMLSIPFAGWIGPCVAASLIGLGIAVESEIRAKRWMGAVVLGSLLIGGGLLDRHSGALAMLAKVADAEQAHADRLAAYTVAVEAKATADAEIARLTGLLAVLNGEDVQKAQKLLGVLPDGEWGEATTTAKAAMDRNIREDLHTARADLKAAALIVSAGAPAAETPFDAHDAELYATLITLLSVVLAFAGSYVAHGLGRDPEKEIEELETQVESFEAEVFDLSEWMASRKTA